MDLEDDLPKPKGPLSELIMEDLSPLGAEELQNRIALLNQEIDRCNEAIKARGTTRAAAEAFFKS